MRKNYVKLSPKNIQSYPSYLMLTRNGNQA